MTDQVWAARTGAPDDRFLAFSESTRDDAAYVLDDLAGSAAHVLGLHHVGLLSHDDAMPLLAGLQDLAQAWREGQWPLHPGFEDVHMNVEAALTKRLGDAGKRLHTGRSRNDQVATAITLHAVRGLARLAAAALAAAEALAAQAEVHGDTPWAARTHGQGAQPATLGFFLLAHALRLQDAARHALDTLEAVRESPLGSGAVAGSTLPLDPAHTAHLLGLRPPRNALLATGCRDGVLRACQAAQGAGVAAAGLADDLFDLYTRGALHLPDGFTTGSSLMPQKRNPDVLELVRGHGRALAGPVAAVAAVQGALGLGYVRDLQVTKPPLADALATACTVLDILVPTVQGARFDTAVLAAEAADVALAATDAVEALVLVGVPFRVAYEAVARAQAAAEAGAPMEDALAAQDLSSEALAAALGALAPDPTRRDTLGASAPRRVAEALGGFHAAQAPLRTTLQEAAGRVDVAAHLLTESPKTLLEAP